MEKDKSAAECTRECVKKGTKYALVGGRKFTRWTGTQTGQDSN